MFLRSWHSTHLARVAVALALGNVGALSAEIPQLNSSRPRTSTDGDLDFIRDVQPIFAKSCYACHGPAKQEAGLRLDQMQAALKGSENGPVIVPGHEGKSLLIQRVAGLDKDTGVMPPEGEGEPLTQNQIAILRTWIDQGAKWPEDATHWSLVPVAQVAPPPVKQTAWPRNGVDAFILSRLEAEGVAPSPEADRVTLLRRVYLDLIGLPPTPDEIAEHLADDRGDAFERVVDRLLESPHYGERWGRHWLDAARYADTDGYEEDRARPFAWRYRDWVIHSLNRDMPYNVFSTQQIAGDLLTTEDGEYDEAARIATGFHRNTFLNLEGGVDKEEDRTKRTIDRTNTTGTVWLGLTVGCANCHSHKYDPISQDEYFQLYAFFNSLDEIDISANPAESIEQRPDETPRQQMMEVQEVPAESPDKSMPKSSKKKQSPLDQEITRRAGGAMTMAQAVRERDIPRETYIHERGDFLAKGQTVDTGTPHVLPPLHPRNARANRLDLARWLFTNDNPLPSRVIVNRIWQHYFGRGLVSTSDDFGTQGERPSHPELLDWLAVKLRCDGWRLKSLHRVLVTSATYRQTSVARPELIERDPYNTWLARQNRLRVEAEIVRDLALAVSGLLHKEVGGPSVRPPQASGLYDLAYAGPTGFANWDESVGKDRYRRGMYVWFQRISPYPSLMAFDAPETNVSCTRRQRSNTPLQSLTLLNDSVFVECAQAVGLAAATGATADAKQSERASIRIKYAFRQCLGRSPTAVELQILSKLYQQASGHFLKDAGACQSFLNTELPAGLDPVEAASCIAVARAIMNLDEFLTRE